MWFYFDSLLDVSNFLAIYFISVGLRKDKLFIYYLSLMGFVTHEIMFKLMLNKIVIAISFPVPTISARFTYDRAKPWLGLHDSGGPQTLNWKKKKNIFARFFLGIFFLHFSLSCLVYKSPAALFINFFITPLIFRT